MSSVNNLIGHAQSADMEKCFTLYCICTMAGQTGVWVGWDKEPQSLPVGHGVGLVVRRSGLRELSNWCHCLCWGTLGPLAKMLTKTLTKRSFPLPLTVASHPG